MKIMTFVLLMIFPLITYAVKSAEMKAPYSSELELYQTSLSTLLEDNNWRKIKSIVEPIKYELGSVARQLNAESYEILNVINGRYLIVEGKGRSWDFIDIEKGTKLNLRHGYDTNISQTPLIYNDTYIDVYKEPIEIRKLDGNSLTAEIHKKNHPGSASAAYIKNDKLFIYNARNHSFYYGRDRYLYEIDLKSNRYVGRKVVNKSYKKIEKDYYSFRSSFINNKKSGSVIYSENYTIKYENKSIHVIDSAENKYTYNTGSSAEYIYDERSNSLIVEFGSKLAVVPLSDLIERTEINIEKEKYRKSFVADLNSYFESMDYSVANIEKLRMYSKIFPQFLSREELESRTKTAFDSVAKNKGFKLIGDIKKTSKGERYVPVVSNTYYSSEDQSYYVNGEYVHKSKPKRETVSSGGYSVDVTGYDLYFAIDNDSEVPSIATFEASWSETEYYYKKVKDRCLSRFFACLDWSYKNERKERTNLRHFKQNFLVGKGGRAKHKIYLGEKEPNDLVFYITNFLKVDEGLFEKFEYVTSNSALDNRDSARSAYKNIYQNKVIQDFSDILTNRMKEVEDHHKNIFNDNNSSLVTVDVVFDKKFDPDFESSVTVLVKSKEKPLIVNINTPVGVEENIILNSLSSGWEFYGYCFFCEYTDSFEIERIKGYSKQQVLEKVSVQFVFDPLDTWKL